jgi:hypothetical protein
MSKKYLIVSGDSFTEGHQMGEQASWAYWVAKELNLELINLSCGGKGNEWISNNLLSYLATMEIPYEECIVMVGWSDLSRQMTFLDIDEKEDPARLVDVVIGDLLHPSDNLEYDSKLRYIYKNRKSLYPIFSSVVWCLFRTYQSIFYTRMFLENKNIPFIFFDVISDNKVYYKNKISYIKKSYLDFTNEDLEEIPYIDDVISGMIGERNVDYIFDNKYLTFEDKTVLGWLKKDGNFKYEVGNDGHTNIEGAKEISKYIVEQYKNIYL